jgi:hypothetical protein
MSTPTERALVDGERAAEMLNERRRREAAETKLKYEQEYYDSLLLAVTRTLASSTKETAPEFAGKINAVVDDLMEDRAVYHAMLAERHGKTAKHRIEE